jgi:hypothetical protein
VSQTLYVTFADSNTAQKAVAALLDNGVDKDAISVISSNADNVDETKTAEKDDDEAKTGITTTTAADAGVGAAKGAGIGLGLGIVAGLVALTIPGVGLVLGGGTLAAAIAAAGAATAAGVVAGGVTGYLKDQGLSEDAVITYSNQLENGGSLVVVNLPSGGVHLEQGEEIIAKYNGTNVNVY